MALLAGWAPCELAALDAQQRPGQMRRSRRALMGEGGAKEVVRALVLPASFRILAKLREKWERDGEKEGNRKRERGGGGRWGGRGRGWGWG